MMKIGFSVLFIMIYLGETVTILVIKFFSIDFKLV